ncbi:hypothetical protein [Mycolicibacterium tusciae]|uniref:hypothetical protein n=1 Tax=Mycolicibacterium tusciae TaxID=75922 RepID=UPI0002EA6A03|nr:hypothetical protein [Mycolicibacterium tusciae]
MDTVGVSDSSLLVSDVVASADSLVDVAVLLVVDVGLVSAPGSSASDDGSDVAEVADVAADSLAVVAVDEGDSLAVVASAEGAAVVPGAVVMGACEAVVTSASLGSAGTTVVTGGATVVDGASTGACVSTGAGACVTGGACVTAGAGASAGACGATSTGSGAETSGAGATTVVVGPLSSPGAAMAGAIPPVSAVRQITTPVARTATTPRFEQNSRGAPTLIDSFISPDNCLAQERSPLPSQKVHR